MNFDNGEWDEPDMEEAPDDIGAGCIYGIAAIALIIVIATIWLRA